MNLWRITFTYDNRADHTSVENVGYANWLRGCLRDAAKRHSLVGTSVLSVKAESVSGAPGESWEWLNPDAEYHPAHARNAVDAGAQGI
jgi:hypothetical protein